MINRLLADYQASLLGNSTLTAHQVQFLNLILVLLPQVMPGISIPDKQLIAVLQASIRDYYRDNPS